MNIIQTAIIMIGEYNPLIEVCGSPILNRQILRCQSIGIQKIFIIGHFTPETKSYLDKKYTKANTQIIFEDQKNIWTQLATEKESHKILLISCEHYVDIHLFKSIINEDVNPNEILMFGDATPTEISTVRPRILLTKEGEPIDLLDRARSEAVWMGMAILHESVLQRLAQRKNNLSPVTLKQIGTITDYAQTRLVKVNALFWDRIDSSSIGMNISQEVLYHADTNRALLNIWEKGISHPIIKILDFDPTAILPITFLFAALSLSGGFCLASNHTTIGLLGLFLTLVGVLLSRSVQEIKNLQISRKHSGGSQLLASRLSMLGIISGLLFNNNFPTLSFTERNILHFVAIGTLLLITIVEVYKKNTTYHLEQAPIRYTYARKWQRFVLKTLNLHWIWYSYPLFYALDLFQNYFSLLTIEIHFFYLIFLLQLSKSKNSITIINETT